MFDIPLDIIMTLFRNGGSGYINTILLFLILLSSRGTKRAVQDLEESLNKLEATHEARIVSIEKDIKIIDGRLSRIEK